MRGLKYVMNVILGIMILGTISCSTARIPKDIQKAKETVLAKTREIEAIVSYHDLKSPFTVRDTIIFRTPVVNRTLEFPVNIETDLQLVYDKYILPVSGEDTVLRDNIKRDISNIPVTYSYQDSLISIDVSGNLRNMKIEYILKEREFEKPVEYDGFVIDTKVKWHENARFLKRVTSILILLLLITLGILIIKWKGPSIRPPFPF